MTNFPLQKELYPLVTDGYMDDLERIREIYQTLEFFETDYKWDPISDTSITPVIYFEWEFLNKQLGEKYISQASRILSLGGGGNSPTINYLPEFYEFMCVLNPSERDLMLYKERVLGEKKILLVRGVGESIPFADASFDLVEIPATLDHCHDHRKVLEECYRVLQPGGKIALTCGNEKSWYRNLINKLKLPITETHQHHHTIHLEPLLIENLLTSVGFSKVQISTNYFLKLPKSIERLMTSRKVLSIYGWISNTLFPKVVGSKKGGMLLAGAMK